MAQVPLLPSDPTPVQNPGVPQVRIEPMTPAANPASIYQAAAGIGKQVEGIGAQLEQHMVMQSRLRAQQEEYQTLDQFRTEFQNGISNPDDGILAKYRGVNAVGAPAVPATGGRSDINDIPGMPPNNPGTPGTPAKPGAVDALNSLASRLKQKYMNNPDGSPRGIAEQARLEHLFDGVIDMQHGRMVNYALSQSEAAGQAISEAHIDSLMKSASLVTPMTVKDGNTPSVIQGLNDLKNGISGDITINNRIAFSPSAQKPQEALNQINQDHADEFVKMAVVEQAKKNYADAQTVLKQARGRVSPSMVQYLQENIVDGAKVDQLSKTAWTAASTDTSQQLEDGHVDPDKMRALAASSFPMPMKDGKEVQDQHVKNLRDSFMKSIQEQDNDADRQLAEKNKAASVAFASKVSDPTKISLADANRLAVSSAAMQRNGKPDGADLQANKDYVDKIFNSDKKEAMTAAYHNMDIALKQKLGNPSRISEMKASILQQQIDGKIHSPTDFADLVDKNLKTTVPSGLWYSRDPTYGNAVLSLIKQNPSLVRAVGSENAVGLSQRLGAKAFVPDSKESKALAGMASSGWPMDRIGPDHLKWAQGILESGKKIPAPTPAKSANQ